MTQRKDLTGLTFDLLTVASLHSRTDKAVRWNCICQCGNTTIKNGTQLTPSRATKYRQSCGCTRAANVKAARWTGHNEISGTYLRNLRSNATQRGIEYSISPEYIWSIYVQQHSSCALSGTPIDFTSNTASLDRIDSSVGYVEGNVQWVHKTVNNMKWDCTEQEFIQWCSLVSSPLTHTTQNPSCIILPHHKNWKGVGNIPLDFYTRYHAGAKKRQIPFAVSIIELWNKFVEQQGYCMMTGVPILIGSALVDVTASIDRVDNSVGYQADNIQWVHKDYNTKIRKNLSVAEVLDWCSKIIKHKISSRVC